MNLPDRREFVAASSALVAGVATKQVASAARRADEPIVIGLIGCGGRGTHMAERFKQQTGVELAYVCDPQQARREDATKKLAAKNAVADFRRILDDKRVAAVIVATPDHWHAPAAIMACDAGKHVYVEKPCSHNVREGRLLVEAARRNDRRVQHGTQCRSTSMMIEGVKLLRDGIIGTVLAAKAWNIQRRGSIGRGRASDPPPGFDYDTWVGPATMIPYQENRVNGGWHWWHHFGTGDMGNDGVHDIDYARWGLGVDTHPSTISAAGGKFFFDDDQEFPDTQQVTFEYPGDLSVGESKDGKRMLIYEQRLWSTNYPLNVDSGVEYYGTAGQMFMSRRGKIAVWKDRNQRVDVDARPVGQDEDAHIANFLDAIRGAEKLNAEIELGHLSSSLCHLGNIATRLGRSLRFDPKAEQIVGDDEANRLVGRNYREHWGAPKA
ncbi:MAG: Gfo/Idh/MocA family oxidoreductase [Pirellulales bacterium]